MFSQTPIGEQRFIILDTETTGNDTKSDRPIEIALVEWKNGESGEIAQWFVNPNMPIKPAASAVHHITADAIAGADDLDAIRPAVEKFIGDSPIVIHNAPFDLAMLPFLERHPVVCSLRLARHTWDKGEKNTWGEELQSHKAQEIRYWLGLDVDTRGLAAHRAAADILVCGHIFQAAVDKYLEKGLDDNVEALISHCASPIKYGVFPYGMHAGQPFEKLPQSFVDFYLDPNRNKSPDPDLLHLVRDEQKRRMAKDEAAKDEAAIFRKSGPGGSFRPAAR